MLILSNVASVDKYMVLAQTANVKILLMGIQGYNMILTLDKKEIQQEDFKFYHWLVVCLVYFIGSIAFLLVCMILPFAFMVGYLWKLITGHYPSWIKVI